MPISRTVRGLVAASAVAALLFVLFPPSAAWAHSLDSSTISIRATGDSVHATISFAIETLDEALGANYTGASDVDNYAEEIVAYIDDHLTVTSIDGAVWAETYSNPARESVEGIESFSVDVAFDVGNSATSNFTIAYDAIAEALPNHETVVVLTDANNDISSPGILDRADNTVEVTGASGSVSVPDVIQYGFDHVLEGADHLLFLITLLLPAPLTVAVGRWRRADSMLGTLKKVVHVVTAFTIGHSLTLLLSALGWVSLSGRPVELLIAVSVGVSAIHAIRPLAARGEEIVAAGFGLVHGLAFAGILAGLGLESSTSLLALLAFNIGIELSQLVTVLLVFPSLYLLSRTHLYPTFRLAGASAAIAMAAGWALDRTGILGSPFAGIEESLIANSTWVVVGLATFGVVASMTERVLNTRRDVAWAGGDGSERG